MDINFLLDTFWALLQGVPLTLALAFISVALGLFLALSLAAMMLSRVPVLAIPARAYVVVFRGTPLLVQMFLIYYGLGQFTFIRETFLWTFLREPFWCAILSLALNTAAYASEILRGGLLSVPRGQVEAAISCGMSKTLLWRRILLPIAVRQALPGYGNELIGMIKATSVASLITLMEVTGIAASIIAETYRVVEVFVVAGVVYLAINLTLTRLLHWIDFRLTPHLRQRPMEKSAEASA